MNALNMVGFGLFTFFGLFALAATVFLMREAWKTRRGRKVWGEIHELEAITEEGQAYVLPTVRYTGVSGRPLIRPTRTAVSPERYRLRQRVEIMDVPGRRFAVLADQRMSYLFGLFPIPIALGFLGVAWMVWTGDIVFMDRGR